MNKLLPMILPLRRWCLIAALTGWHMAACAQTAAAVQLVRSTDLRSDKLATAPVLVSLPGGSSVRVLSIEGGWAWVQASGQSGWVRANTLDLQAGTAGVSRLETGRSGGGNSAMTLGVRSVPPRANRHALIIGISRYADASIPTLPGTKHDRDSATQMAHTMQVPDANIRYLSDEQATGDGIRKAIRDLNDSVLEGDRVFIHYSGHGTRYKDPNAGGCVEALLAHDGGWSGTVTNKEMSELLKPIVDKTDKLFVMYDACFSGGVVANASPLRTRGFSVPTDEGALRPKFSSITEECGRPVNVKTRNLVVEQTQTGALSQDLIHLSSSRDNEVSFDDESKGGLATQYVRDCMLRDAKDQDGSGAITMDEIRTCAQEKINHRLQGSTDFKPHNLTLNGNSQFIPAWFGQPVANAVGIASTTAGQQVAQPAQTAVAAVAMATTAIASVSPSPSQNKPAANAQSSSSAGAHAPAAQQPAQAQPASLTGAQALQQMYDQRDAKRKVNTSIAKASLRIGADPLDFSIESDRAGYLYVALAGSDNKSVYLLFPNDIDTSNRIEAGHKIQLPRKGWQIKAAGPEGMDTLLVLVADGPRDLSALQSSKAGPFVKSLNDTAGRAQLGSLLSRSQAQQAECSRLDARRNNPACSDAYGASMFNIQEVK